MTETSKFEHLFPLIMIALTSFLCLLYQTYNKTLGGVYKDDKHDVMILTV